MKNIIVKKFFVWVWCFPQMLAGLIFKLVTGAKRIDDHYHHSIASIGSASLGEYIFLDPSNWYDEDTLKHERGHTRQSYILGWFYLLIIGLPSLVWCVCFAGFRKKHNISYRSFYTEKWADQLGGVQ